MKNLEVPIWKKINLTIEEAACYSGIGENRLREEVNKPGCEFVISIGERKKIIKRKEFEQWNSTLIEI